MTGTEQSSEDLHWTYAAPSGNDLQQGDIISPSEDCGAVLGEVHPHFSKPEHPLFMVLTHSCDLVRGRVGTACKAPYIALASIRRLEDVLAKLLSQAGIKPLGRTEGIFDLKSRDRAQALLRRVFNQNEQGLGLFYLHPDARVEIHEASVVFLRVTFSLQSKHYDLLLNDRVGALSKEFQPKLGWLAGNLYSRVGTRDWGNSELNKLVIDYLPKDMEDRGESQPIFFQKNVVKEALGGELSKIDRLPRAEVVKAVKSHKIDSPKDIALVRIREVLGGIFCGEHQKQIEKAMRMLEGDQKFSNTIRGG